MGFIDAVREALAIADRFDDLPLKRAILNLQQELQGQVDTNFELRQENQRMKERIAELERVEDLSARLVFRNKAYWLQPEEEGGKESGPFCVGCWDEKRRLHRLIWQNGDVFACAVCKSNFWGIE